MKNNYKFIKTKKTTIVFYYLMVLIFLLNSGILKAQLFKGQEFKQSNPSVGFIENKGQITDQNYQPNPKVRFLLNMSGLNIQLRSNGFSYDAYTVEWQKVKKDLENPLPVEEPDQPIMHFHRIDIEFIGANQSPVIKAEEPGNDYMNYYTPGTTEAGANYVNHYRKITYKDLYPGIDLVFQAKQGTTKPVEYSFVVHPGADFSVIKWRYNGNNGIELSDGNIQIKTVPGVLVEDIPLSYEMETGNKVKLFYKEMPGEIYTFEGKNDSRKTLVIDPIPNPKWVTYFGGSLVDVGYSVTTDLSGNVLATGYTTSTAGIATTGAFITTFAGTQDAFAVKFNSSGVRQWSTYIGGTTITTGCSVKTDKTGNVFIAGSSQSTTNIATTGAFQTANGGGGYYDAFLEKFDPTGVRQWGTYYGGTGNDLSYYNSMVLDTAGNIYMDGVCNSTGTQMSTAGAFKTTMLTSGDAYDGFLIKFNSLGARQWSTYFGGPTTDYGMGLGIDANSNLLMTGYTISTSAIATIGVYQTSFGGGTNDAYLAKFNTSGALQWCTYFGGALADVAYRSAADPAGNIYMVGYTVSTSLIASTGAYQTTYGGGNNDGYIVKFSPTGSRIWSTYFGGSLADVLYSIAVDQNGNLFVAGASASTTGIASTGAYQTVLGGGATPYDAVLAKFTSLGVLQWSTYYGGTGDDIIMGLSLDASGSIYIAGQTVSTTAIATTGAYQTANAGGTYDAFIGKLQELVGNNNAGINRLTNPPGYLCAGTQDVKIEILNAGLNTINTLDVRWQVDGVSQTPVSITTPLLPGTIQSITLGSVTFPLNTLKTIKAWTYMPNGVPDTVKGNDTIVVLRKAGLSGTYSIGGASPDYPTFTAAINDLNSYGVCGPTVFQVRRGTYNERITLNQLAGCSGVNTVSFIGADKTATILSSSGTSTTDMFTILLNGADHISFRNMTIKNTGPTYGNGIWFTGAADTNKFVNLAVVVDTTSTSTTVNCIVGSATTTASTSDGTTGNSNTFDSIDVKGGYYGVRINGPNTTTIYSIQNSVTHSTFSQQYQGSIYFREQSMPVVSFNILKPLRYTTSYGIYMDYCSNIEMAKNFINANDCGIYLNYVNRYLVNTTFTSRMFNNMISSISGYALYSNQSYLLKLWHNSFSSDPASAVVRFAGCQTTDLVNCHLLNRGTTVLRYALYADAASTFGTLDYNNYYTTGSFVYIGTTDYGNLPVLQAALPAFNKNSYSQDPLFFSSTDLHTSINLPGTYLGIDDDIDGDFRNTVSPVLGADEVNIPNNAGIARLISPVPAFCAGTQSVIVQIGNYGINKIDSVVVNWQLDGVTKTPVVIKSTINLRGYLNVNLGSVLFAIGDSKKLKIWTSMPNGIVDPFPKNDTLVIIVKTGMNGIYTIGGTSPDFTTFNQAVSALTQLGICSPVLFNVRAGTYSERVTIPPIKGASSINTITFAGAGKANTNLSYSATSLSDWATLYLKGADHFIFRDMTISVMGTTYGIGIQLTTHADTNKFVNVMVQASTTVSVSTLAGIAVMTSATDFYAVPGQPGDGNVFDSVSVSGGYYGIYLGGNSANQFITHCTLNDQSSSSMDCNYQNYLRAFHNTITSSRTGVFCGINLSRSSNFLVYDNSVNLGADNGIYIQTCNVTNLDSNSPSRVYNNMVTNTVGYSLYCESSLFIKIWHNSVRSVGTSTAYYAAIYLKSSGNMDLRDNHIRNDNPNSYSLYADFGTFDSLDYNNYYSFGNFVMIGSAFPNLTSLRLGLPAFNKNSYSQDPQYIALTNLHTSSFLPGKFLGIVEDIDGEPRCPKTVSVGADDENWGFPKPVISTNHTNFFTNYPVRFLNNISGKPGIIYKWYINGSYITDSVSFQYTFHSAGTYKINLQAERCIYKDSANLTIQILPGNQMIILKGHNPDSNRVYTSYSDPGFTCKDYFGNNISSLVKKGNNIDTAVLGKYFIWYKVTDAWGNKDSVSRTVIIMDDVDPVLTLKGNDTIIIEVFQHINDPGAKVTDNYDTSLTIIVDSSKVNTNVVGIYKINYHSTDHSGNTGIISRWVIVRDTVSPVIKLIGKDTIRVDVYGQYFEPGAKVTDNYCTTGLSWKVDLYPNTDSLGTYVITYTATDCQGNHALAVKRVILVVDRQKPVISLKGFAYVSLKRWMTYNDSGVNISDNYYSEDTLLKLLKTSGNLDMNNVGIYNICYEVTDPSGNKSSKVCRIIAVLDSIKISINNDFANKILLYPNPGRDRFILDLGKEFSGQAEVVVTDLTGKDLYHTMINGRQSNLDLKDLAAGYYLVMIRHNDESATIRLSIIR